MDTVQDVAGAAREPTATFVSHQFRAKPKKPLRRDRPRSSAAASDTGHRRGAEAARADTDRRRRSGLHWLEPAPPRCASNAEFLVLDRFRIDTIVKLQYWYPDVPASVLAAVVTALAPAPDVEMYLRVDANVAYERKPEQWTTEQLDRPGPAVRASGGAAPFRACPRPPRHHPKKWRRPRCAAPSERCGDGTRRVVSARRTEVRAAC